MVKCKKCNYTIEDKNRPAICIKCGNVMTPIVEKKKKPKEVVETSDGKELEKLED